MLDSRVMNEESSLNAVGVGVVVNAPSVPTPLLEPSAVLCVSEKADEDDAGGFIDVSAVGTVDS